MAFSQDQMEPQPQEGDLNIPPVSGSGHGAQMCSAPRHGVLVTVRRLKERGVNLSVVQRRQSVPVVGELKISRVHDRAEC